MLKIDSVAVFQDDDPWIAPARGRVPAPDQEAEPIPRIAVTVAGGARVTVPEFDASAGVFDALEHARAYIAYYRPGTRFCGETLACAR